MYLVYLNIEFIKCYWTSNVIGQEEHTNAYAPFRKKVLFTIWLLSRPVTFLARDRFNIPTSSAHNIFKEIIGVLVDLIPQYIQWPNRIHKNICVDVSIKNYYY